MAELPHHAVLDALRLALRAAGSALADAPLSLLTDKGLAHHHVRLGGSGQLARIPKQSQMGLAAPAALAYEAACFERAAASGHVPRLHGTLAPSAALPRGALLVDEVIGRAARLPQDLVAMARALGAIHSMPLPAAARSAARRRRPAGGAAFGEIDRQAEYLDAAALGAGGTRARSSACAR